MLRTIAYPFLSLTFYTKFLYSKRKTTIRTKPIADLFYVHLQVTGVFYVYQWVVRGGEDYNPPK